MKEYIEREAAKKEFNLNFGGVSHAVIASGILDALPAADVAPVVHGKWVDYMVRDFHCSVCKEKLKGHGWEGYYKYDLPKYCPNCGCRMNGIEQIIGTGHSESRWMDGE